MDALYFRGPEDMRAWLERHHATSKELWVGIYKKGSGRTGISYDDLVEVALCFGWIDGMIRGVDEISYMQRLSPRTSKSPWSQTNVAKALRLISEGRMHPSGKAVFEQRSPSRSRTYGYENRPRRLGSSSSKVLKADPMAWKFFQAQPPSYRRTMAHWIASAQREGTRERRTQLLLRACQRRKRLDPLFPGRPV